MLNRTIESTAKRTMPLASATVLFLLLLNCQLLNCSVALGATVEGAPLLDLSVRRVQCSEGREGFRFQVRHLGGPAVPLSDLSIKFWAYDPGRLKARFWSAGSVGPVEGATREVRSPRSAVEMLRVFLAAPTEKRANHMAVFSVGDGTSLSEGETWRDAYFTIDWSGTDREGYSRADGDCTDGLFPDNYKGAPGVCLFLKDELVSEWNDSGGPDASTGRVPIPPVLLGGEPREPESRLILSPSDGERVGPKVEIALSELFREGLRLQWAAAEEGPWRSLKTFERDRRRFASWNAEGIEAGDYWIQAKEDPTGTVREKLKVRLGEPAAEAWVLPDAVEPGPVAAGPSRVYALDGERQLVRVLDGAGLTVASWGGYGSRKGELSRVSALAALADGSILAADPANGRLQALGGGDAVWGAKLLVSPRSVAATRRGVYVLDGGRVHVFGVDGAYLYSGFPEKDGYSALATDDGGRLYLLDAGKGRVDAYSPGFMLEASWKGPGGWKPTQLTACGLRVFVADKASNRILKFGPDGNLLASLGSYGNGLGRLDKPDFVAASDGRLVVADTGNRRLTVFRLEEGKPAAAWTHPTPVNVPPAPLSLSGLSTDPASFNPLLGGVVIAYRLSRTALTAISVSGTGGETVFETVRPSGSEGGLQGMNRVGWDGRSGGKALPPGDYRVFVRASDGEEQVVADALVRLTDSDAVPPTSTPVHTDTPLPSPTPSPTKTLTPTFTPVPPTLTPTPHGCGRPPVLILRPVFECVSGPGVGPYYAHFGYVNESRDGCGRPISVDIPVGSGNRLLPANGAQVVHFRPGRVMDAFRVAVNADAEAVWVLAGSEARGNRDSKPCRLYHR